MNKEYLGDSVYVEVERGMLKLTTYNGMGPSNTIFLEDETMDALTSYYGRAKKAAEDSAAAMAAALREAREAQEAKEAANG